MSHTHTLITGGAGFIGCNSADYFLRAGHQVTIYDNSVAHRRPIQPRLAPRHSR